MTDRADIQAIVWQYAQQADGKDSVSIISRLDTEFSNHREVARGKYKVGAWVDWFYSGCFALVYSQMRVQARTRAASGAYIVNSIVNHLLLTDGHAAVSVFGALAGKDPGPEDWMNADRKSPTSR